MLNFNLCFEIIIVSYRFSLPSPPAKPFHLPFLAPLLILYVCVYAWKCNIWMFLHYLYYIYINISLYHDTCMFSALAIVSSSLGADSSSHFQIPSLHVVCCRFCFPFLCVALAPRCARFKSIAATTTQELSAACNSFCRVEVSWAFLDLLWHICCSCRLSLFS